METLTIKLPKAAREFVDEQAAAGGYRSASAYLAALVRAERKRRAEELLVRLVEEADASRPAMLLVPDEWDQIRQEVAVGIAKRKRRKQRP